MRRTLLGAAVAVATLLGGITGAPAAGAAAAAVPCTVKANLPAKIAVTKHYTEVPVRLTGCTGRLRWAFTDIYGSQGLLDILGWHGSPDTDYLAIYDWEPMGTYRTTDWSGSTNPCCDEPGFSNSTVVVKYGSRIALRAQRSNGVTYVGAGTTRWDPHYNIWGGWAPQKGKSVAIYAAKSANGPWKKVAVGQTDANGIKVFAIHASGVRYWQARTSDSTKIFGAASPVRHA